MYSSIAFLANGVQTDFTFPFPYLDKAHIAASVDGATAAFTWVGSNTIRLSPAPALNHLVRISRSSNRQQRIADYQDGQLLTEADLDADARQLFYVAQEAFDAVASAPAGGDMRGAMNLSDVSNAAQALANIGGLSRTGDTMVGPLLLTAPITLPNQAVTKAYVDSAFGGPGGTGIVSSVNGRIGDITITDLDVRNALGYFPLSPGGAVMVGPLTLVGPPTSDYMAATKKYVDDQITEKAGSGTAGVASFMGRAGIVTLARADVTTGLGYVPINRAGDSFTGPVLLAGDPTVSLHPATKQYVDTNAVFTGSTLGSGVPVVASKVGNALNFRGITTPGSLLLATSASDLSIAVNTFAQFSWAAQHKFLAATTEYVVPNEGFRLEPLGQAAKVSRMAPAGGVGSVASALHVAVKANSTTTSFEWAQLNQLDNYAAAGENVAFYGKAAKFSTGPTWAGVFEVSDATGSSTSGGIHGIEIDLMTDCTDDNPGASDGLFIVYGSHTDRGSERNAGTWAASSNRTKAANGILIIPNAFHERHRLQSGINIYGYCDAVFRANANGGVAFEAGGLYDTAAFRMRSNQVFRTSGGDANYCDFTFNNADLELQWWCPYGKRFGIPMGAFPPYAFECQSVGAVATTVTAGGSPMVNPHVYLRVKIDGTFYKLAVYLD